MNEELIVRYLKGEASPEEQQLMKKWIEEDGDGWLERFIEERWLIAGPARSAGEKRRLKKKMLAAIKAQEQTPVVAISQTGPVGQTSRFWRITIASTAAACVLLVVGFWLWRSSGVQPEQAGSIGAVLYQNDSIGKIKVVRLPDGTMVTLNVFSTLRVPANYGVRTREVALSGEAFFEVTHNVDKPFIVRAAGAETRVYGTAFDVSAYPHSSEVRVGLQSGSIGVRYHGEGVKEGERILKPGELVIRDKAGSWIRMEEEAVGEMGAWRKGDLVFYKAPLKDVLEQLENKYGVKFSYPMDLNDQTITASFDGSTPMAKVLADLSFAWNLHFQQEEDSIYVK